jgi:hypothetical protein
MRPVSARLAVQPFPLRQFLPLAVVACALGAGGGGGMVVVFDNLRLQASEFPPKTVRREKARP